MFFKLLQWYYRTGLRGFHCLNRTVNAGGMLVVPNQYGVKFQLRPDSYIDSFVLREGYYESEIIEYIKTNMPDAATFWDIGANFGLHAITVQKLFPDSRVVAFEPLPHMRERIRANADLNRGQVHVCAEALSNSNTEAILYTDSTGSEGRSSLFENPAVLQQSIAVTCRRADALIEGGSVPFPTAIKIDVEGAELNVLEGFGRYLQDSRLRFIIFEAPETLLESTTEIPSLLTAAHFAVKKLTRREATAHPLANFVAFRNYLDR